MDLVFKEYIDQLNDFFIPKTPSHFKKLVSIFTGDLEGDISVWNIRPTNHTFRNIVYRGEMQPDLWTKYRYLFLEIWHPGNQDLQSNIANERDCCRKKIFSSLYNWYKAEYCKDNEKSDIKLAQEELEDIFEKSFLTYNALLKNISSGDILKNKNEMKEACSSIPAYDIDEADE